MGYNSIEQLSMYIVLSEVEKGWEAQKRANISHDMSQTPQIDNSIVE